METTNIIFSGVGGQGIILSSRIVAQCAFVAGNMVKMNELHGMAQRGGSVISHLRFGKEVNSPLIPAGKCDYLIALEELEGLRYAPYLKAGGTVIINKKKVMPAGLDESLYPHDIREQLEKCGFNVQEINASGIAKELGNQRVENIVLLGLVSKFLDFPESTWQDVIKESVPEKTIDINLEAFKRGREQKVTERKGK